VLGPLEVIVYFHPPDGRGHAAWLQFIGRFHSLVVHLPICLIVLVPVLEVMARFKRGRASRGTKVRTRRAAGRSLLPLVRFSAPGPL
jgi:hypothetical protein